MTFLLTLLGYSLTVGRFILSPKAGLFWFLTLIALTPRYIGIGVGDAGLALSAQRLTALTLFLIVVLLAVLGKLRLPEAGQRMRRNFAYGLLGLFLVSAVSAFMGGESYFVLPFTEDIVILTLAYIAACFAAQDRNGPKKIVLFLFMIPLAISSFFVLIEALRQAPALTGILDSADILTSREFTEGKFRGGAYRAKALFDGPLLLAEFATYSVPALLFLFSRRELKLASFLFFLCLAFFCVLQTGTRSGLLITLIAISFHIFSHTMLRVRAVGLVVVQFAIVGGFGIVAALLLYQLSNFETVDSFYQIKDAHARSTYARLLQYGIVTDLMNRSPIIGFGYQRNYAQAFEAIYTLDNHFLRVLLQSGIVGTVFFLSSLVYALIKATSMIYSKVSEQVQLGIYLMNATIAFSLFKIFLSQPYNNVYFYVVVLFVLTWSSMRSPSHRRPAPKAADPSREQPAAT